MTLCAQVQMPTVVLRWSKNICHPKHQTGLSECSFTLMLNFCMSKWKVQHFKEQACKSKKDEEARWFCVQNFGSQILGPKSMLCCSHSCPGCQGRVWRTLAVWFSCLSRWAAMHEAQSFLDGGNLAPHVNDWSKFFRVRILTART